MKERPIIFRVAEQIGWHRDEFGWHRQGRIERIVGQTGLGRWWFAPENKGLPWVLDHAPKFDTEAEATRTCGAGPRL